VTLKHAAGILLAFGLEALAGAAGLRGDTATALALHVASSAAMAASLGSILLDGEGPWSFALPFASAFFVPVLGATGLVAVAAAVPRRINGGLRIQQPFLRTALPSHPDVSGSKRADAVKEVQGSEAEREGRMAALVAVKHRRDPAAVALLWRGLKDPEEEVRLLAFSLLESKVSAAYRAIQSLSKDLETAGEDQRGLIHTRLAFAHWELAWQGLVQGEVLGHELSKASEHARHALEHDPRSASVQLLRARIQIRRGRLAEADVALRCARVLGIPATSLRPYEAELAFCQKRFDEVRRHLSHPSLASGNSAAARVQRYWC
jgi:hypothetical protein